MNDVTPLVVVLPLEENSVANDGWVAPRMKRGAIKSMRVVTLILLSPTRNGRPRGLSDFGCSDLPPPEIHRATDQAEAREEDSER